MNQGSSTPHIVTDYLQRLEAATADLPPDVRADLVADVRSHLDEAVERADSEAQLRQAIERLGSPEAIAAEARGGRPAAPPAAPAPRSVPGAPPVPPRTSSRGFDVTALLFLVLGGLVLSFVLSWLGLVLGWTIGIGMLWASRSWTFGEKLLGSSIWPGGLAAPLLLGAVTTRVCTSAATGGTGVDEVVTETTCTGFALPVWVGVPLLIVLAAAPLVVAGVLLQRADRRR